MRARSSLLLTTFTALVLVACGRDAATSGSTNAVDASVAMATANVARPVAEIARDVSAMREALTFRDGDGRISLVPAAEAIAMDPDGEWIVPRFASKRSEHADVVRLPATADRPSRVAWRGVSVDVRLAGASPSTATTTLGGESFFRDVFPAASMLQVAMPTGVEDFIRFDGKPARSSLTYEVTLEGVAGLRLVSNTLELLDATGRPRLRTTEPIVVDANRKVVHGTISVEGCAYDSSLEIPWDRAVVAPGAKSCAVTFAWSDASLAYPIVVDPGWTTTSRLTVPRYGHTTTTFQTASGSATCTAGCMLVVGGYDATRAPITVKTTEVGDGTSWTVTDEIPAAPEAGRVTHAATNDGGGKVIVAGGQTSASTLVANGYIFDVTAAAGSKWTNAGAMPGGARSDLQAAFVLSQNFAPLPATPTAFFVGGRGSAGASNAIDAYNFKTPGWESSPGTLTTPRYYHALVGWNQLRSGIGPRYTVLAVAGGVTDTGTATDSIEIVNFTTGTTTLHMSSPRIFPTAVVTDNDGYLLFTGGASGFGGGGIDYATIDQVSAVAPTSLTTPGSLSRARRYVGGAAVIGVSRLVVFAGGQSVTTPFADADLVSLSSGFVAAPTSHLNYARSQHGVVSLPNVGVFAVGGFSTSGGTTDTMPAFEENFIAAANGQSCGADGDCLSFHCVDGVCCDTTCTGQCQACDVATSKGTCTTVSGAPHGTRPSCAGTNATCKGYCDGSSPTSCTMPGSSVVCVSESCSGGVQTNAAYCDGVGDCAAPTTTACVRYVCGSPGCKTSCASNGDCATGYRCDLSAGSATYTQCIPSGALGSPCDATHVPSDCSSGLTCVDGVCCSSGSCAAGYACNVAGDPGHCHPPLGAACGGTTGIPGSDCIGGNCVDGVCCNSACGGQCQHCDATGTCSRVLSGPPRGTRPACPGSASCAATCDGSADDTCGSYPGTGVVCHPESCAGSTDQPTSYCDGTGGCALAPTKNCAPYVCSGTTCATSCSKAADCATGYTCTGSTCTPKIGVVCSKPSDCTSGYCVDGFCCDSACSGQCQACNVPGAEGKCQPVVGEQPHGSRTKCSDGGGDVCKALQCDGSRDVTKCVGFANGPDKVCSQSCTAGTASEAFCDGLGTCGAPKTTSCGAYACDTKTCKTSCAADADCAKGYGCDATSKTCVPVKATCSDDGLSSNPADKSAQKACAPYRCNPSTGDCFPSCSTTDQCAPGSICTGGACVPQANGGDTGSSGGCDVSSLGGGGGAASFAGLAWLAALGAWRRRRRA